MNLINDFENSIINLEIEKAVDIHKKSFLLRKYQWNDIFKSISKL